MAVIHLSQVFYYSIVLKKNFNIIFFYVSEQLKEIMKYSFKNLVCDNNSDLDVVAENPFIVPSDKNPLIPCSSVHKMNYKLWQELKH